MDNKQSFPPADAGRNPNQTTDPVQAVQQPPTGVVPPQPASNNNGNNKMLWIIIGLVVVILLVGGIYWYMTNQQKATTTTVSQPTPISESVNTLEKDLNSTSLDDLDKEFSSVDTDLERL